MGDGWETSRRRDQANDWVAVRLACAGSVEVAELDTSHFVGNAPGWATLRGDGGDLVPRTALQPDTRHRFAVPGSPVTREVRLDIYPDGGMARLRVLGRPTAAARAALAARFLRLLPEAQLAGVLRGAGLSAAEAGQLGGELSGDLAGDLSGGLAGDLAGDLSGDLAGDLTGRLPAVLREQLRLSS
jgi:allantoicase